MNAVLEAKMKIAEGRVLVITIRGNSYPDTYWDQGGFDPDDKDPMTLEWEDGSAVTPFEDGYFWEDAYDYAMDNGVFADMCIPEDYGWED